MRIVIVGEGSNRTIELDRALADFDMEVSWLGPDEAVALASDLTVHAFVVGMRVGVLHGPALLAELGAKHPEAVRILLLDPDQDPGAMLGLDCAHRLLPRPMDAGELIEAVESVADLRGLLGSSEMKQAIGRVGALPPPPRLYIELTRLLRNPDASNSAIAGMLSQDPGIAAKVLRLCNSAYFSGGREIADMRAAVTRLGHQALRRLVLTSETFGTLQPVGGLDREAMQDRALRTSRLAGKLLGGPSAEMASTAGLLAEVGLLLPGLKPGSEDGPHYAEAGAYLLGLWGLPMPIVEGVAYHHRPTSLRASGFWVAGAVHVASALVGERPVDEDYLRSVGQLDKLPLWRSLAEPSLQAA